MGQNNSPKKVKAKPYVIKPAEVFAPEGKGGCRDQSSEKK